MRLIRRYLLLFLAALAASSTTAYPADVRLELKNDAAMAVSVPLGTDDGVTKESDFEAVSMDNVPVLLYPDELFGTLFWSQPLPEEVFSRINPGSAVRPITLPKEEHAALRAEGRERKSELEALREEALREAARKDAGEMRERRDRLEARRDALVDRIGAAEKALADEEGKAEWVTSSEDRDIDRSLQNILEYADQRDELQEQRNALSARRPYPSSELSRINAEIKRLNDRIASERNAIRNAKDRKRSARSSYLSSRQEWRKLVAERNQVSDEIRSIDRKIRELEKLRGGDPW